jgi:hypothetical protein
VATCLWHRIYMIYFLDLDTGHYTYSKRIDIFTAKRYPYEYHVI